MRCSQSTRIVLAGGLQDASEKGDGMQRALMLAILQTYCAFRREKGDDSSKYFLFFIDAPGTGTCL